MLSLLTTTTVATLALSAPTQRPGPEPVSPYRFQQIYHKHRVSVLRIRSTTPQGPRDGSAFLISADGVLLTTQRLIRAAQRIELIDDSGRSLAVQLVAQDPALDVAVLRAASTGGLPSLALGTGRRLREGDWVVGIGHQAEGGIVSRAGCVSQVGRQRYIIDAATPTGGAVLDLQGRVVALALRPKGARRTVVLAVGAILPLLKKISLEDHAPARSGRSPS